MIIQLKEISYRANGTEFTNNQLLLMDGVMDTALFSRTTKVSYKSQAIYTNLYS